MADAAWQPYERDISAVRRNTIRRAFAEVISELNVSEDSARKYFEDALASRYETVEEKLVVITKASHTLYGCSVCGIPISNYNKTGTCQICRERAEKGKCIDCKCVVGKGSQRCVSCAMKQRNRRRELEQKKRGK